MTDKQVDILCNLFNIFNSIPSDVTKIIINKVNFNYNNKLKLIIKFQSLYRGKKYRNGFGYNLPRTHRLNTPISVIRKKRRQDWYRVYYKNK